MDGSLTIGDDVTGLLAGNGYDPVYGARHLQRNIERLLLEPLASLAPGEYRAEVDGDAIRWAFRT